MSIFLKLKKNSDSIKKISRLNNEEVKKQLINRLLFAWLTCLQCEHNTEDLNECAARAYVAILKVPEKGGL